ncbi:MAG: alpha/beta hydrolase [Chamaesiphon sp.]|nr:alpha/beta hydrolase [Chamaesiphon sp.]
MSISASLRWVKASAIATIITISMPISVRAVEQITLHYPPFKDFSISVRDLELFAKKGQIAPAFATYIKQTTPEQLQQLRQLLQQRMDISPTYATQIANAPLIQTLLERLGEVIQTEDLTNGQQSLRLALVRAAADKNVGLTPINFLYQFPGRKMNINLSEGFAVYANFSQLLKQRDLMIVALKQIAQAEAATTKIDFSTKLDLRKSGRFGYQIRRFEWLDRSRQRLVPGDLYLPQATSTSPISLIVISHGVAEDRTTFAYLAKHLVSHGFAVAVVEHIGGDADRFRKYFSGLAPAPGATELLQRPRDISFLLDELQRLAVNDPSLRQLNLKQVGAIGHSLGGYTALALAGATIDFEQVTQDCTPNRSLNLSVLLQCRANELEFKLHALQDPRIKAIFAINPLDSTIFGQRGMSQVRVPVLMMGGSDDIITPAVSEQIHPFTWLQTSDKYLAILEKGTHFSTLTFSKQDSVFPVSKSLIGPDPQIAQTYVKALGVAFFQTHLAQRQEFQTYLNAGYANSISRVSLPLNLVRSSASAQIRRILQQDNVRVGIPASEKN